MEDIEDILRVKPTNASVISCSRRTDIPFFYLQEYLDHFKLGYIDVPNPMYKKQISRVDLSSETVKCIVWWSKNFKKWIKEYSSDTSILRKYSLHLFNFTINGELKTELEPGINTSLDDRLNQLKWFAETFSPEHILLRFDPIVHYIKDGIKKDNLIDFEKIMCFANSIGIKSLRFSFCSPYSKVSKNFEKHNLKLVTLSKPEKHQILDHIISICDKYDLVLYSCSDDDIVGYRGKIFRSSCVDGHLISRLLGEKITKAKDSGQRKMCGCTKSKDIGIYTKKCNHKCVYCYSLQ